MDKSLKKYDKYIKNEIDNLEKADISKDELRQKAQDLLSCHEHAVRNFQHERLIHLIVTIFFAAMLIFSTSALFIEKSLNFFYINNLLAAIVAILFVVQIFYIRHYYLLENGTEKLYEQSKRLFDIIKK